MIAAPSASAASIRHESTLRPSTRTVHAPHSPTRQHSFVPVRPRSSRSDVEQRVVRQRRRPTARRPLTRQLDRPIRSRRDAAAAAARSPLPTPAARGRGASRAGTRGSPASSVGDGLASANSASSSAALSASGARGSASSPLVVGDEQRPRPDAAVRDPRHAVGRDGAGQRDRRQVVPAPARPPHVDGPARPVGHRQLDRRRPARRGASVVTPGADEEVVERDPPRARPGRPRRPRRRRRAAPGAVSAAGDALQMLPGERRPVPDLDRPDDERRLGEGRVVAPDRVVGGDVGHHRQRADPAARPPASRDPPVELGDPLDVDDDVAAGSIPSRSRMIRSVPPASEPRAAGPCAASSATASVEAGPAARRRRVASAR